MWIGANSEEVKKLQEIIENELVSVGIEKDKKGFHTHITVARVKNIRNARVFKEKVKKYRLKDLDFSVKSFSLIKSELTKEGAKYKTLKKFKLK